MYRKLILIMLGMSLAILITGCESTIKPEKAAEDFASSIVFDNETGILSFTIPKGLSAAYSFNILVAGRIKMDDIGMSFHLFEEENDNNSWEQGKTYSHEFVKDSLLECIISFGVQEDSNPKLLTDTEIEIWIDENGNIHYGYE